MFPSNSVGAAKVVGPSYNTRTSAGRRRDDDATVTRLALGRKMWIDSRTKFDMSILIDGYNLLHVTGIFGSGPSSFQRSREALLDFLAASIDPAEISRTTIVFDSREAPPGLPRMLKHSGLTVHFASNYESADELLEELIRGETSPRKLTVVSSDHRVQRAAKRRRATAIDSEVWHAELVRSAQRRGAEGRGASETKPAGPLSNVEVQWWLDHFRARDFVEPANEPPPPTARLPAPTSPRTSSSATPAGKSSKKARQAGKLARKPAARSSRIPEDLRNPFPPGYAADVLREFGEE